MAIIAVKKLWHSPVNKTVFVLASFFCTMALQAKEFKYWPKPEAAMESVASRLSAQDYDGITHLLADSLGKGEAEVAPIAKGLQSVFGDQKITAVDITEPVKMGSLLCKYYIVVRDADDNFVYVRVQFMRLNKGWLLSNFVFNTNLNKIRPEYGE